jgi:methylmalonyl-CoA/ethylmalonyl-CoA epimerase
MASTSAAAGAAFGLDRVGQIAVVVQDVARATAFYRDVLGMRFLFAAPPGLAFFDCGGVRLMLSRPEGPDGAAAGSAIIYSPVDNIQAAYATLVARGAPGESPPHVVAPMGARDLWMAFVRDSERNLLGLMCEVPRG